MSRVPIRLAPHDAQLVDTDARQLQAALVAAGLVPPADYDELPAAVRALLWNMAADPYSFSDRAPWR